MPIYISLAAMTTNQSISSPISNFCKRFNSPSLAGANPFRKYLPCGFCQKRNVFLSRVLAARSSPNPRRRIKTQSEKNLLKAKRSAKQAAEPSMISEMLNSEEDVELSESQAIGVAVCAQANFIRVIVRKVRGNVFEEESDDVGMFEFKENRDPHENIQSIESGKALSGKNYQVNNGFNEQTVNGVMETSSGIKCHDDNGHSSISIPISAMDVDKLNRTIERNTDRNLDAYDVMEDRAEMGIRPEGYKREDNGNNNIHKGTENFGESHESVDNRREGIELLCHVRALLKKIKRRVLVGDKVLVGGIDWADKRGMILDVVERRSELTDPPVANVDHLLVLFSLDQPKLEPFTMTRFLVEAESVDIPFTLVLNKTDLVQEEYLHAWKDRLQTWGYEPLFCSAGSSLGLTDIANVLKNRTSVVVGPSGVGKSRLINALRCGLDICIENEMNLFAGQMEEGSKWFEELRVGDISRGGHGKHTTRNVTLLPLQSGGYLTDTPGFSQPSLLNVTKSTLGWMFPEIRKMLNSDDSVRCLFNNCLHVGDKGCAVKGDWERYPYYLKLLDEIKKREEIQLRLSGTKRESKVRYKVGQMGVTKAEPRLQTNKHRKQSRKRFNQSISEELSKVLEDREY